MHGQIDYLREEAAAGNKDAAEALFNLGCVTKSQTLATEGYYALAQLEVEKLDAMRIRLLDLTSSGTQHEIRVHGQRKGNRIRYPFSDEMNAEAGGMNLVGFRLVIKGAHEELASRVESGSGLSVLQGYGGNLTTVKHYESPQIWDRFETLYLKMPQGIWSSVSFEIDLPDATPEIDIDLLCRFEGIELPLKVGILNP